MTLRRFTVPRPTLSPHITAAARLASLLAAGTIVVDDVAVAAVRTDAGWLYHWHGVAPKDPSTTSAATSEGEHGGSEKGNDTATPDGETAKVHSVVPQLLVDCSPSMVSYEFMDPAIKAMQRTAQRFHDVQRKNPCMDLSKGSTIVFSAKAASELTSQLRDKSAVRNLTGSVWGNTAPGEAFDKMIEHLASVPEGSFVPVTFLTDGEFNNTGERGGRDDVFQFTKWDELWIAVAKDIQSLCMSRGLSVSVHAIGLQNDSLDQIKEMQAAFQRIEVPFTYATVTTASEIANAFTVAAEVSLDRAAPKVTLAPASSKKTADGQGDKKGREFPLVLHAGSFTCTAHAADLPALPAASAEASAASKAATLAKLFPAPEGADVEAYMSWAADAVELTVAASLLTRFTADQIDAVAKDAADSKGDDIEMMRSRAKEIMEGVVHRMTAVEKQWAYVQKDAREIIRALPTRARADDDDDADAALPLLEKAEAAFDAAVSMQVRLNQITDRESSRKMVFESAAAVRSARTTSPSLAKFLDRRAEVAKYRQGSDATFTATVESVDSETKAVKVEDGTTSRRVAFAPTSVLDEILPLLAGGSSTSHSKSNVGLTDLVGIRFTSDSPSLPHSDVAPAGIAVTFGGPGFGSGAATGSEHALSLVPQAEFSPHGKSHQVPVLANVAFEHSKGTIERTLARMCAGDSTCFAPRHIRVYCGIAGHLATSARVDTPAGLAACVALLRSFKHLWGKYEYAFVASRMPLLAPDLLAKLARGETPRSTFKSPFEMFAIAVTATDGDLASAADIFHRRNVNAAEASKTKSDNAATSGRFARSILPETSTPMAAAPTGEEIRRLAIETALRQYASDIAPRCRTEIQLLALGGSQADTAKPTSTMVSDVTASTAKSIAEAAANGVGALQFASVGCIDGRDAVAVVRETMTVPEKRRTATTKAQAPPPAADVRVSEDFQAFTRLSAIAGSPAIRSLLTDGPEIFEPTAAKACVKAASELAAAVARGSTTEGLSVGAGEVLLPDAAVAALQRSKQTSHDPHSDAALLEQSSQASLWRALPTDTRTRLEEEWIRDALFPPVAMTPTQALLVSHIFESVKRGSKNSINGSNVGAFDAAALSITNAQWQTAAATAIAALPSETQDAIAAAPQNMEAFRSAVLSVLPPTTKEMVAFAEQGPLASISPANAPLTAAFKRLRTMPPTRSSEVIVSSRTLLPVNAIGFPGSPQFLTPASRRIVRKHMLRFACIEASMATREAISKYSPTYVKGLHVRGAVSSGSPSSGGVMEAVTQTVGLFGVTEEDAFVRRFMEDYAPRLPRDEGLAMAVHPLVEQYAVELFRMHRDK